MRKLFYFVLSIINLIALSREQTINVPKQHPFSYDLGIKIVPSTTKQDEITICCHGYGCSNALVDSLSSYHVLPGHLVGFNFPDHDITPEVDPRTTTFGTINEILPLLYLLKYYTYNLQVRRIHLYGFSAGGGAIINALAILNHCLYSGQLDQIGISREDTKCIVHALEDGYIILDCPLKSIEEIIAFRGKTPELEIMALRYKENDMSPIVTLSKLSGLKLNIVVHFQDPDEVLSNRDGALFVERLQQVNRGRTMVVISSDGGHNAYHAGLWNYCKRKHLFS